MTSTATGSAVLTADRLLRPRLGDRLLAPADAGYEPARTLWNAAVTARPALIARCLDTADVVAVVDAARSLGLPLSVRSGGHDWAGRALVEGGLVADVTGMRSVRVDPATRSATVGAGATAADLLAAAGEHGLAMPTGVVRAVGLAGLTMAGGYGPLNGRFGLALDNLLSAEVVLADGRVVTAAPNGDTDLYWALRGGGGNFGVVTSMRFRLHPVPAVLAGMLMFPLAAAGPVLAGYREVAAGAPDELTVMTGFLPGPAGEPVVFLCPFWSGADLAAGERIVDRLRALATPVVDRIAAMPYDAALGMFDGSMVDGNRYLLRTRWLPAVSAEAAAVLTARAAAMTSAYSALAVHHFHGASTRVAPSATAFARRTEHALVEIIAVWPPGDDGAPHVAWADRTSELLEPLALPGGYPNLLGPHETERVRLAYGANLDRLLVAKHRFDPTNLFSSGVPTLPTDG